MFKIQSLQLQVTTQTIISSDPIRVCKLEACKLGVLFVCALSWQYD